MPPFPPADMPPEVQEASSSEDGPVVLSADQPAHIAWLEVVGTSSAPPTEEEYQERVQARQEYLRQKRRWERSQARKAAQEQKAQAALADAGAGADATPVPAAEEDDEDAEDDDEAEDDVDLENLGDEEMSEAEVEQELSKPVERMELRSTELRTCSRVLERQLAPVLHGRTAGEIFAARAEAQQNLDSLEVLSRQAYTPIQLHLMPVPPDSLPEVAIAGNTVKRISKRTGAHPTVLERLGAKVVRAAWKVGAAIGVVDEDDLKEELQPGAVRSIGGLGFSRAPRSLPLKLTLLLPPEKRRWYLKTDLKTSGSLNTSDLGLDGGVRNAFGFGERLYLNVTQGCGSGSLFDWERNSLLVGASMPELVTRQSRSTVEVSVNRLHLPDSSLQQTIKGVSLAWTPYSGRHTLRLDVAQRELHASSALLTETGEVADRDFQPSSSSAGRSVLSNPFASPASASSSSSSDSKPSVPRWREPSPSIQSMVAGGLGQSHSMKASIQYCYARSSRGMDQFNPGQGWMTRVQGEYAGLGGAVGDAHFLRGEVESKRFWSFPLLPRSWGVSFGVGALGQVVHNLSAKTPRVYLGDRLFLGSALTTRGFAPNTVGPRDGADALGGELALSAAAHLSVDLGSHGGGATRAHLFYNAGNMLGLRNDVSGGSDAATAAAAGSLDAHASGVFPRSTPLASLASELAASSRHSVGLGLSWNLMGGARLEINATKVLRKQPQDAVHPWPMQLGIGVQWV